ncbi:MAG: hypothetical protein O8C64_09405 [Candidatus Methanoperedens sp.]|jgi:Zn finger protein HypA/HybF involved in hydrogenase expression|nr:hypothetical protein [Candidatus Methanoperedens sp.]MCZ7405225.1 hypothetical protein [Candidatus Methanoperedens sp.]
MCFADSSVNVEIEEGELVTEQYKCIDCNSRFRGIGKKIRCPTCESVNVKKI